MTTTDTEPPCPFCGPPDDRIFAQNILAFALWDGYPVSAGHTLVIPRRHISSWFDATEAERVALCELIDAAKAIIDPLHSPDGYNIGINIGNAAGQTVFHLHVHLIPRFVGDIGDPRGGVRHVIPSKAIYRTELDSCSMPDHAPKK